MAKKTQGKKHESGKAKTPSLRSNSRQFKTAYQLVKAKWEHELLRRIQACIKLDIVDNSLEELSESFDRLRELLENPPETVDLEMRHLGHLLDSIRDATLSINPAANDAVGEAPVGNEKLPKHLQAVAEAAAPYKPQATGRAYEVCSESEIISRCRSFPQALAQAVAHAIKNQTTVWLFRGKEKLLVVDNDHILFASGEAAGALRR